MVLAIALNFCLLHAIGLGAIDAAVRLRSKPNRRTFVDLEHSSFQLRVVQKVPKKLMHDKGHIPLDGKPIKDRFGFDQFQKSGNFALSISHSVRLRTFWRPFQKEIKARAVEDSTFFE